jgi:hypothetical protein
VLLKSVPVPLSESDLEAHEIAEPSGVHNTSRLCLPLPFLRCQDIFSVPSLVFPSPGLLGPWPPPMKNL